MLLVKEITLQECEDILSTFQTGKTPGSDGIPVEFYKIFWSLSGKLMTDSFNEAYLKKEMSTPQKQAVITLIEKKGKDRNYLENWRPISLINVDAKIASKIIATRNVKVLPEIIHPNQLGYVKGRFIGEAARSILDVMDYTKKENIPGILLFIDFEKAFDSLNWNFLLRCLDVFGFGPSLIKWVETFYANISSCVLNNGFCKPYFELQRGVRQGDPLSPYLFIIAGEILATAIRDTCRSDIKGIKLGQNEFKLVQYAGDLTIIFNFLWKGPDKIARQAVINDVEFGGLNITDIETLIKASRLAWIGKLFSNGSLPWKAHLNHLLKDFGGEFLFSCNYDVEECNISSKFYNEFLQWWTDFRELFSTKPPMSKYIIWNNKDIKIDNKSIYYPNYVKDGILLCHHLQFDKENLQSYNNVRCVGLQNTNFLVWTGVRSAIPSHLKIECPNEKELGPLEFFVEKKHLTLLLVRVSSFIACYCP